MKKYWLGLLFPFLITATQAQGRAPEPICETDREVEYISALLSPGVRESDPDLFLESIQCLGKIQSIAAVNPLVKVLDYRRSFLWDGTSVHQLVPLVGRYPAAGALAEIGLPALPSLTLALARTDVDLQPGRALVDAVRIIFKNDLDKTLEYLHKAAVAAASDDEKVQLAKAAAQIEELKRIVSR